MVKQRELARKELLALERQLFKQRSEFKETKRKLGIKGDDEDLVNQKVEPLLRVMSLALTMNSQRKRSSSPLLSRSRLLNYASLSQGLVQLMI